MIIHVDLLSVVTGVCRGDTLSPASCRWQLLCPSTVVPLQFPVSRCPMMGARQSAVLHWGQCQRRGAKDVSKILSLGEALHQGS